jgi:hypothetical protein
VAIQCKDCNRDLDLSYESPPAEPCPKCGSTNRRLFASVTCEARVQVHAKTKWWAPPSHNKAERWGETGNDFFRETGRWNTLVRIYDKVKDWYYEHIVDEETGEVLAHQEHKLSEHHGHGSAKPKDKQ